MELFFQSNRLLYVESLFQALFYATAHTVGLAQLSENVAECLTDFTGEKMSSGTYMKGETSIIYGHKINVVSF